MDKKLVVKDFSVFYENCIADHKALWTKMKEILIEDLKCDPMYLSNSTIRHLKNRAFSKVHFKMGFLSLKPEQYRYFKEFTHTCFFCWYSFIVFTNTGGYDRRMFCRNCPHKPFRGDSYFGICETLSDSPYCRLLDFSFDDIDEILSHKDEILSLFDEIINLETTPVV